MRLIIVLAGLFAISCAQDEKISTKGKRQDASFNGLKLTVTLPDGEVEEVYTRATEYKVFTLAEFGGLSRTQNLQVLSDYWLYVDLKKDGKVIHSDKKKAGGLNWTIPLKDEGEYTLDVVARHTTNPEKYAESSWSKKIIVDRSGPTAKISGETIANPASGKSKVSLIVEADAGSACSTGEILSALDDKKKAKIDLTLEEGKYVLKDQTIEQDLGTSLVAIIVCQDEAGNKSQTSFAIPTADYILNMVVTGREVVVEEEDTYLKLSYKFVDASGADANQEFILAIANQISIFVFDNGDGKDFENQRLESFTQSFSVDGSFEISFLVPDGEASYDLGLIATRTPRLFSAENAEGEIKEYLSEVVSESYPLP